MQGRGSGKVRDFALYGETTGETDEFGLPVRYNWAAEYRGAAMVVYGHTPVPEPEWLNRTINIDTGCVFGGKLTALRYPERELVSVPAARTYCEPARPFLPPSSRRPALTAQQAHDEVLDVEDVLGKRIVSTRLRGNVTIREENATAALEVMSRFAVDPQWLIYLPPTMSPLRDERASRACWSTRPRRSPTTAAQGVAAGRLRGEAHGLAGGRRRLPRRGRRAATGSASPTASVGIVYTRTGRRVLRRRRRWSASSSTGSAAALDGRRPLGRARDRLGLPRLRADAVVGQGAGAAATPVRRRSAPRRRRRCPRRSARWTQAAARWRGDERTSCRASRRVPARERRRPATSTPTGTTAGRSTSLDDLKLAPFHLLATEGARPHRPGPRLAHGDAGRRSAAADPELLLATPLPGRGRDRPGERGGRRSPGGRS